MPAVARAAEYQLDTGHTSIVFKIQHLGISYTYGRIDAGEGRFVVDEPSHEATEFSVTMKADSVDTGLAKRDEHLRNPDFLNAKQFPVIAFNSTEVEDDGGVLRVTGELMLHGVTRPLTIELAKVGEGEDPWGGYRIGYEGVFSFKRSDYGMTNMLDAVGDDITVMISFEGLRQ